VRSFLCDILSLSLSLRSESFFCAEVGRSKRDTGEQERKALWISIGLGFLSEFVAQKPRPQKKFVTVCEFFFKRRKRKATHKRERAIAFFFYRADANVIFSRVSSVGVVRAERGETR
jgi:hypothetical protein